jgi:hypothetical protein
LHKNWALYDVEHVVFQPRQMTPERLQEGLEWTWKQSYSWRSIATRISGSPWSILPLWVSTNLGYRYYARHLHDKTWPIYRDEAYMAEVRKTATPGPGLVGLTSNLKNKPELATSCKG